MFPGSVPLEQMSLQGIVKSRTYGHVLSLIVKGNHEEIAIHAQALGALSTNVQGIDLRELFLEIIGQEAL